VVDDGLPAGALRSTADRFLDADRRALSFPIREGLVGQGRL
jgi:hypothetical protein